MYTLLIPREQSLKEKKTGRNNPFWASYWKKQLEENPEHYKREYSQRVNGLNKLVVDINQKYENLGKKYYVEAKFDDFANKKTKEPSELWKESGVQIVETREDGSVTLSGSRIAFKKLEELLSQASFDDASEEKYSKKQNLSREVFSVTSIVDKNDSSDKRLSKAITLLISSGYTDPINCILTVYYDRGQNEYDSFFEILNSKLGDKIAKVDSRFFISNMSFRAYITPHEAQALLQDPETNFISFIKPTQIFGAQRTTPNSDPSTLQIGALLTSESAVLIDSGVSSQILNRFVSQRENLLESGDVVDTNHGTSVASRLLFGNDIFSGTQTGKQIFPVGKIIDFQVIHRDGNNDLFVPDDRLMDAIDKSVRKYKNVATIFNLSISAQHQIDELNVNEITEMIDTYSNKNDVLFVCAVGNQKGNFPLGYDAIFNTLGIDSCIASPGDALNALSVGSIASVADANSICATPDFPSPFTRKGGIRKDYKKPELVAPGGNIKIDPSNLYGAAHLLDSHRVYGVEVIDSSGFSKDSGTSLSAPVITRECLRLLGYLKKSNIQDRLPAFATNKANLVKALLIHSTERVKQAVLSNDAVKRAYGWGQPDSQAIIKDDDNQFTVVYADKISFSEKKQKVLIKLPEFLLNKPVELTFTFVYNPPVNKNFQEYKMIDLQPSIRFIHPKGVEEGDEDFGKTRAIANNPTHSWEDYRNIHFNTVHFKKTRSRLTGLDLEVLVSMLISNRLLEENVGSENNISQNYSFILTVKDLSESGQLRSEILNTNQFFELVENTVQVES